MSRRAITKAVRNLKSEIVADIEQIISRETGRLEAVSSTPTCTSSATPSSSQDQAPTLVPAIEQSDDQAGVVVSQEAGKQIYSLIETTEDLISLERQGKRRAFEKKSLEAEELIVSLDNCLLSQVNLTGEPAPTN
jgi:hypothetical protein